MFLLHVRMQNWAFVIHGFDKELNPSRGLDSIGEDDYFGVIRKGFDVADQKGDSLNFTIGKANFLNQALGQKQLRALVDDFGLGWEVNSGQQRLEFWNVLKLASLLFISLLFIILIFVIKFVIFSKFIFLLIELIVFAQFIIFALSFIVGLNLICFLPFSLDGILLALELSGQGGWYEEDSTF